MLLFVVVSSEASQQRLRSTLNLVRGVASVPRGARTVVVGAVESLTPCRRGLFLLLGSHRPRLQVQL